MNIRVGSNQSESKRNGVKVGMNSYIYSKTWNEKDCKSIYILHIYIIYGVVNGDLFLHIKLPTIWLMDIGCTSEKIAIQSQGGSLAPKECTITVFPSVRRF
jgi:hypothetical protein